MKSDIMVGAVTLTGHVRTWTEHDAVVGTAWMAPGAIQARDELEVIAYRPAVTRRPVQ